MITRSGRAFIIDVAFGDFNWASGATKGYSGQIFAGVGSSLEPNVGLSPSLLPTKTQSVPQSGAWQGAELTDWKLTSEYTGISGATRIACSVERIDGPAGVVSFRISKDSLNLSNKDGPLEINEIGLFLGDDMGYPRTDPTSIGANAKDRGNAMIARSTNYKKVVEDGVDKYLANPKYVTGNSQEEMTYFVGDFMGGR